jgi:hypothetical protein
MVIAPRRAEVAQQANAASPDTEKLCGAQESFPQSPESINVSGVGKVVAGQFDGRL